VEKRLELLRPDSCLSKAEPDEPIFILRAKDALAPQAVRLWASMAFGAHEIEKVNEALELAVQMERWHSDRGEKVCSIESPQRSQPLSAMYCDHRR